MNRDFVAELLTKMEAEQEEYRAMLLQLSPAELLDRAFEYTWREEILMSVDAGYLSSKQANALRKLKNPLDACYQEWKKADCDYLDSLRSSITGRADAAIREQKIKAGRDSL